MPSAHTLAIQNGWKVYAGADEVGVVADVARDHILIRDGVIRQHRYHVPLTYVLEAGDGVVDLSIDREQLRGMEIDTNGDFDRGASRDANDERPDDAPEAQPRIRGWNEPPRV